MSAAVMTEPIAETSPISSANIAGVFYLTSMLTGGAAAFVRWRLVIPGDAMATATNILAHEPLFRMLLAADLISVSCFVVVTLLLWEMFKGVAKRISLLAALSGLVGCLTAAFAFLFQIAALVILRGGQHLNIAAVEPLRALVSLCLKLRAQAYSVSLVFLGFYCLLIGYLILRSTFRPRKPHHAQLEKGAY